jgi:hypothetical protein
MRGFVHCRAWIALLGLVLIASSNAYAQTWDGGGTDDFWTTVNNWSPNGVPANNGTANLVFDGVTRLAPKVNINWSVNSVTFAPFAGAFDIQGSGLSVLTIGAGGITNTDTGGQRISVPVNFSANSSINATAGGVTLAGNIGLGTSAVTINGAFDTTISSFINFSGTGSFTKNGAGNFRISSDGSSQNYDLILNAGTIDFTGAGPVYGANSSIQLNAGTMSLNSVLTLTLNSNATFTKASAATLSLGAGMTIQSGADATFSGTYSTTPSALYRVTGSGSTLTAAEFLVGDDARLELTSLATGTFNSRFTVGAITNGTVVVDNATLNATSVTSIPTVGSSGGTGSLTVRNLGSVDMTGKLLVVGSAVSQDSKAIFFDTVSGGAAFTGSGTKYFEAGSPALGPVQTSGSSVIEAAASVTATRFREDNLTVNGEVSITPDGSAAGTSVLNSLSIDGSSDAWEGRLTLNNNSLIVRSGDLLTITSQIRDGLDSSGGLIGSALPNRRLGAITNGLAGAPLYSSFQGISGLLGGEVLVRDVIIGDLNLDGTVSISDFIDLAANFNRTGNTTWAMGDVNYDNAVTISDFIDLASNFNQSLSGEALALDDLPPQLSAALQSVVPEPASLGLVAVVAVLLPRRTHFKPHPRPRR